VTADRALDQLDAALHPDGGATPRDLINELRGHLDRIGARASETGDTLIIDETLDATHTLESLEADL